MKGIQRKVKVKSFIVISCLLFVGIAGATTFRRLPLEQLIEESSAAAEVKLLKQRTFANELGMILTEHSFQVMEKYNLDSGDLDGEMLRLTMAGGTLNGLTSYVDGAPDFSVGERSFLLLKKIENRLYLSNFSLGKFKIVQEGEKTFYLSSVFPADTDMGKVAKERMIELLRTKFKMSSVEQKQPLAPRSLWAVREKTPLKKIEYRTPAQVVETRQESVRLKLLVVTLITFIISGLVGCLVFVKKEGHQ